MSNQGPSDSDKAPASTPYPSFVPPSSLPIAIVPAYQKASQTITLSGSAPARCVRDVVDHEKKSKSNDRPQTMLEYMAQITKERESSEEAGYSCSPPGAHAKRSNTKY